MKIGVIVAMDKELKLLLPLIESCKDLTINGYTFYHGTISGVAIVAAKCGIGKVNAAVGTLTMIDAFNPDMIINTGVAGGTGRNAGVLDVIVADRIAYHDVWCGPGTEWGQAADCPRFFHTSDAVNALATLTADDTVKHGLIASGDIFVSRSEDIDRIRALYPDVEGVDMESGAIAQVCFMRAVPFACLRVISDTPGADDNETQYTNFWEQAPEHTFGILRSIIREISTQS